jgi:hypothetical protein
MDYMVLPTASTADTSTSIAVTKVTLRPPTVAVLPHSLTTQGAIRVLATGLWIALQMALTTREVFILSVVACIIFHLSNTTYQVTDDWDRFGRPCVSRGRPLSHLWWPSVVATIACLLVLYYRDGGVMTWVAGGVAVGALLVAIEKRIGPCVCVFVSVIVFSAPATAAEILIDYFDYTVAWRR